MTIIIIVAIAFFALVAWGASMNAARKELIAKEIQKIEQTGFKITNSTIVEGNAILWDRNGEKVAIVNQYPKGANHLIFDFAAIRDCELIKDGEIISKRSTMRTVGGAVVGGVLLGGVGAVVGGLSGKTTGKEKINKLALKIHFHSIDKPTANVNFISDATPEMQKKALGQVATEWNDRLMAIIDKNELALPKPTAAAASPTSKADEISKYKALLDSGAVTPEEYESAKARLLNS